MHHLFLILVNNFDDVVDVTIEAEAIGVKSDAMFDSLLEDSQNAADVKEVVAVASSIGAKDKESLESVFTNVSQADSVKEVVQVAADLGAQNKENLGSVFKNADKADDLNEVMQVAAKALGTDDGSGTKKLGSEQASVMASTLQERRQSGLHEISYGRCSEHGNSGWNKPNICFSKCRSSR